jgi:tetratricopeptide (TPR) repeat protein
MPPNGPTSTPSTCSTRSPTAAQERRHLDAAEHWYQRALAINEQLGNRPGVAKTYHQLGRVEHLRSNLDAAERWYRLALATNEQLDNRPGVATGYHQLGLLAEHRGTLTEALEWTIRSVTVLADFPHPATSQASAQLARLTNAVGWTTVDAMWREVTGRRLPAAVIEHIRAIQAEGPRT